MTDVDILVVPGWGGSASGHWQVLWVENDPRARLVKQRDWDQPDRDDWLATLDAAARAAASPVALVAHSLGCHVVAHWAAQCAVPVKGALLVAPPNIEQSVALGAAAVAGFDPPSSESLPFPALLAASQTDPWASLAWSRGLANQWGAIFVDLGDAGHVNPASGYGPWPEGRSLLHSLVAD